VRLSYPDIPNNNVYPIFPIESAMFGASPTFRQSHIILLPICHNMAIPWYLHDITIPIQELCRCIAALADSGWHPMPKAGFPHGWSCCVNWQKRTAGPRWLGFIPMRNSGWMYLFMWGPFVGGEKIVSKFSRKPTKRPDRVYFTIPPNGVSNGTPNSSFRSVN